MKIKGINIEDYGPIRKFSLSPGNFELIFGLNESGKTAIVEALSYILFNKSSKTLRYGKPEHITIAIESSGKVYNVPTKKMSIELPPVEIAGLLYVQASESAVYEKDGVEHFWDGLKLILSQASKNIPFAELGEKVLDCAGLMPKEKEWKREKQALINSEKKRIEELSNYFKESGEVEKKRVELKKISDDHKVLQEEMVNIEAYKKYINFRRLQDWYNEYIDENNNLAHYNRYETQFGEQWQELEAQKSSQIHSVEIVKRTREEIENLEIELNSLKTKDKLIEDANFMLYKMSQEETQKEPSIFYSVLTFLIGFATIILSLNFKFIWLFAISIPLFVISIVLLRGFLYKKATIRKDVYRREMELEKAKLIFPEIASLALLENKIETVKREKLTKETLLNEKIELIKNLSAMQSITKIEEAINELRNKTGLAEISQLKEKIEEKARIKARIEGLGAKIGETLFEKDESKWQRLINNKKVEKIEKEPDLTREDEITNNLRSLQNKIFETEKYITIFEETMRTKFNVTNDYQALIEYARLEKQLKDYELEKKAALIAAEIFNQMSDELDNFIQNIVSGENSLNDYFQMVTGHYKEVVVKNKDFLAIDNNRKEYPSNKLSSGAKDQLLLCFRIAALKRIYPEGTFLILDDAFIFADWNRRRRLAELLKKFIQDNNQVIYLTSDDHTRDLFQRCGAKVTII